MRFTAPLTNPSPQGLYPATMWNEETGPTRWLDSGVEVRRARPDRAEPSRAEVRQRAQQVFRLEEQTAVEREFAERRLADAADTPEGITLAADVALTSAWGLRLGRRKWTLCTVGASPVRARRHGSTMKSTNNRR